MFKNMTFLKLRDFIPSSFLKRKIPKTLRIVFRYSNAFSSCEILLLCGNLEPFNVLKSSFSDIDQFFSLNQNFYNRQKCIFSFQVQSPHVRILYCGAIWSEVIF